MYLCGHSILQKETDNVYYYGNQNSIVQVKKRTHSEIRRS